MRRLLPLFVLPLLLAAETSPKRPPNDIKRYRLELTVPRQAGIYFSAWAEGDAITDRDGSDGKTVVYKRKFIWYDGCTWEATETIIPTAPDKYDYKYRERPVYQPPGYTCNPDAETPRDGKIVVFPTDPNKPLTPLVGWAKDWDKPRS